MSERTVRLALTVGDPGGIGPEITASLLVRNALGGAECYVIGSAAGLLEALPAAFRERYRVVAVEDRESLAHPPAFPVVVDTGGEVMVPAGRPSAAAGNVAGRAIETAVELARAGLVEGIVTGPVSKEALRLAGYPHRGHTEMFSSLFDAPDCQMMMVSGELRVVILTRDIPLRDVSAAVTGPRIKACVRVTAGALQQLWGIREPRIAVAALNPHAGDGGVTGTEEQKVIIPALEELLAEGYTVDGPLPADTLFCNVQERGYDAFVTLYHDQGMIPFKMSGFAQGVNMTIGLPVVRTSVCHGTAYDIVGRGMSEVGSLEAAVGLAVSSCIIRRRKGKRPETDSGPEMDSGAETGPEVGADPEVETGSRMEKKKGEL
ncbi:MAG: 4-hydroxythreonine-4-phosphate dehydrogenase PdxA [bacterium]|nr:MAG: 4-hydroxythreonine-4-phosphate dehydrogenase PdxA [bacterium]